MKKSTITERQENLIIEIQNEVEISREDLIQHILKFDNGKNSDEDIIYFVIDSVSRT